MKLNRLETHDRLLHFLKDQNDKIAQGADDCLKKNSLSLAFQERSPYIYIFAHPRTDDDGLRKRLLWQPRLLKPKAETNSYLFRAESKTDLLEICWIIPAVEMWGQFTKGKVTESSIAEWSIQQYLHNRKSLEADDPEDMNEERANLIYQSVIKEMREKKHATTVEKTF